MDTDIDRLVDQLTAALTEAGYTTAAVDMDKVRNPCPTCGGTGQITRSHPNDHAYMPRRPITRDCPDCTDRKPT